MVTWWFQRQESRWKLLVILEQKLIMCCNYCAVRGTDLLRMVLVCLETGVGVGKPSFPITPH